MRARYHPGRSTISNANSCWHAYVLVRFTTTFIKVVLLFFSENRKKSRVSKLYIFYTIYVEIPLTVTGGNGSIVTIV